MIRPRPARWFEILAAREDATLVLGALGATGAIELEARPAAGLPAELVELAPLVAQFVELQARYRRYWPTSRERCSPFPEPPPVALSRSLAAIRAWALDAEPLIGVLQRIERQRADLAHWSAVVHAVRDGAIDFAAFRAPGPALRKALFVFPVDARAQVPQGVLARRIDTPTARLLLVVGDSHDLAALAQQCTAAKGRICEAPEWLAGSVPDAREAIARETRALDREHDRVAALLDAIHERHDLLTALGDAHRLQWVTRHVRALEAGPLFCRITGWTSDFRGGTLATAVAASAARALVHFPPAPAGTRPPLLLSNPWWVRPFEIFSRAIGMPSRDEFDPSVLLAFAVPLVFGYMFGDVGQGAVILLGGVLLARRLPLARLFVAGGLSAVVFGLLFGSVFSLPGIVEPRWLEPLDAPLDVLVVPLYGGAFLLTVGLGLAALESFWRGEARRWLATDAGLIVAYLALMASLHDARALHVAAFGAAWFCAGHAVCAKRLGAALTGLGELAERIVQLLVNTLSFARVGAFALAHAGLSAAIVAMMRATDNPLVAALVLVVGNAVVIVLETLVVSIQTTRLVLFEFFTRFLAAEGRVFRPLPTPSALAQEVT